MSDRPYQIFKAINKLPENYTTKTLGSEDALEYHQGLAAYKTTPLTMLPHLAKKYCVKNIYCKDESYRFELNAFKGLGASYAIHSLLQENPAIETFCTATDGNHGRAVAWASKLFDKRAVIFVPRNTTSDRMKAIENQGGTVITVDGNYDETCKIASIRSIAEEWKLVQDTAWPGYERIPAWIMAGYLTHFKELEGEVHQMPRAKADIVFLQAGVGSWAASAIWYYLNRYGQNKPKIVIVEPCQSAGIFESCKKGSRVEPTGSLQTIMTGLNCGIPSSSAWDMIHHNVDVVMKIEDNFAEQAVRTLYYPLENDSRIIAGESGAAGLGGFIAIMSDSKYSALKSSLNINENSNILFFVTEGATDPETFKGIVDGRGNNLPTNLFYTI